MRLAGIPLISLWAGIGAVVGLVIGSFLNVVAYRAPRGLSLSHPASFCPECRVPIAGRDNVPLVSWLLLGGRCRHCRVRIPFRYPAVEAITGIAFVVGALVVRPLDGVPGFWILAATLVAVAASELEGAPCPAYVGLVGAVLGLAALVVGGIWAGRSAGLDGAALGVAVGGIVAATTLRFDSLKQVIGPSGTAAMVAGICYGWLGPVPAAAGVGLAVVVGITQWRLGTALASRQVQFATCLSIGLLGALVAASAS